MSVFSDIYSSLSSSSGVIPRLRALTVSALYNAPALKKPKFNVFATFFASVDFPEPEVPSIAIIIKSP